MFGLAANDIERIDRTSIRILDEIGVRVDDETLRNKALAAGARPGAAAEAIRLPEKMVREYVALAPREAHFADSLGRVTALGPGSGPTFWTGAALNYVSGLQSRAIRSKDLAEFARVADAMDCVYAVVGTSVEDVPPTCRDFVGMGIMARNTAKHLRPLLFTAAGVKPMIEMAKVIAGPRSLADCPIMSLGYSCVSPLHWVPVATEMWRNSSGHRIPLMLNGEPLAGSTSPVTLAGSVALSNAEILAGVVLVELLELGRPVVHNLGFAHTLDMRSAICLSGAAECALMACAGAAMSACYGLPSASWMDTDSFLDDQQAAQEMLLTALAHTMAGVNIVWGMGQLQSQKALSAVQLVMDNEIARWILRFREGFKTAPEHLAFDVIAEAVRSGGDFLSHEHTLEHFRRELSEAPLLARTRRETWQQEGAATLAARAEHRVKDILACQRQPHLSDSQLRDLAAIEKRFLKV